MTKYSYNIKLVLLFAIVCTINACATKKETVSTSLPSTDLEEEMIERTLDPIEVVPELTLDSDSLPKVYRATAKMDYDIIHTSLDLKFDWAKQHVMGVADVSIKPYFHPISSVTLDAVGFDIKEVKVDNALATYTYDSQKLTINLGKSYKRDEKFVINIKYTAKPNEVPAGGSEAITSEKGLFFINPNGTEAEKPMQIWTQGETENNSRWFPTFDKPNERFTQEIKLTVADKYLTLSNGLKISSVKNPDGTRTDHWKQDKPHAPYLAMIAVGEFYEEKDTWEGKPVHYYVEKGWAKHAKKIFNHTPEMLTFFSSKLQYPYPWDKYSQIVVRDYVSGAMENTSAVIFGDFVQKSERELIDNDNDNIVAHEMMHHWFGDLVTCEDWSNLTLNEGFANYAEYLWQEHKYGANRAELHRLNEMNGYFNQNAAHPLIHYYYKDKEDMFDAHSYNKGGLVLHMLRGYLGDEAFFTGLNKYLVDNAYSAVEVDELRLAFEDVTGEDLQWFFDQWFLGKGHPYFDISYNYNESAKTLTVYTDQTQTPPDFHRPFKMAFDLAIYYPDGKKEFKPIMVNRLRDTFVIANVEKPLTYVLDGKNINLGLFEDRKSSEALQAQFMQSPNLYDKIYAFSALNESEEGKAIIKSEPFIDKALSDPAYVIRQFGILSATEGLAARPKYLDKIEKMVTADPHSEVRNMAFATLAEVPDFDMLSLAGLVMESEQTYPVLSSAISYFSDDKEKMKTYFDRYKNETSDALVPSLAAGLADESEEVVSFLESKAKTISNNYVMDFFSGYATYLSDRSTPVIKRSVELLSSLGGDANGNIYRKYMSVRTLTGLKDVLNARAGMDTDAASLAVKIDEIVKNIVAKETNPMLKQRYAEEMEP